MTGFLNRHDGDNRVPHRCHLGAAAEDGELSVAVACQTRSSVHSVLSSVLINVVGIVGHGSQLGRGHRQWTRRQDSCSFRHPNRHADRRCTRPRTHVNFRAFRLRGGSGSALHGRIVHCRAVGLGNRPSESQQSLRPS